MGFGLSCQISILWCKLVYPYYLGAADIQRVSSLVQFFSPQHVLTMFAERPREHITCSPPLSLCVRHFGWLLQKWMKTVQNSWFTKKLTNDVFMSFRKRMPSSLQNDAISKRQGQTKQGYQTLTGKKYNIYIEQSHSWGNMGWQQITTCTFSLLKAMSAMREGQVALGFACSGAETLQGWRQTDEQPV